MGATVSRQSKRLIWHFNAVDCLGPAFCANRLSRPVLLIRVGVSRLKRRLRPKVLRTQGLRTCLRSRELEDKRQKQPKKRSLRAVSEHSEAVFNAVSPTRSRS
ncbi:hypothetical protein FPT12_16530 [Pseudomonas sp. H3(2019)]|nr:hypothetical protein FPT12_16530 [Pseudomonas sp. H3(2019)]